MGEAYVGLINCPKSWTYPVTASTLYTLFSSLKKIFLELSIAIFVGLLKLILDVVPIVVKQKDMEKVLKQIEETLNSNTEMRYR